MKKLVDIREEACLSQEKLAELTGLSRTLISAYELGNVDKPHVKSIKRLADFFSAYSDDIYKQFNCVPQDIFYSLTESKLSFDEIRTILKTAGV